MFEEEMKDLMRCIEYVEKGIYDHISDSDGSFQNQVDELAVKDSYDIDIND